MGATSVGTGELGIVVGEMEVGGAVSIVGVRGTDVVVGPLHAISSNTNKNIKRFIYLFVVHIL